jgi:hypothetical protein
MNNDSIPPGRTQPKLRNRLATEEFGYRYVEEPGESYDSFNYYVCITPECLQYRMAVQERTGAIFCSCPAHHYSHGQPCKHMEALTDILARKNQPAYTRAEVAVITAPNSMEYMSRDCAGINAVNACYAEFCPQGWVLHSTNPYVYESRVFYLVTLERGAK